MKKITILFLLSSTLMNHASDHSQKRPGSPLKGFIPLTALTVTKKRKPRALSLSLSRNVDELIDATNVSEADRAASEFIQHSKSVFSTFGKTGKFDTHPAWRPTTPLSSKSMSPTTPDLN